MAYKVLVVGAGHMGKSHAKAYHAFENSTIVGIVSRTGKSGAELNKMLGSNYPEYNDFDTALNETKPDIVVIATYTEYHADYAIKSMKQGAHVFVEKPLGINVAQAKEV
ncbi:MAG: Gfo/Idh/MocA family oxidoreductase, partial [Cyclobacteriaceae bacterium]|nr:Gfo/Idh/MocA family oxidoreductase [Cyclobacteriaceae bacterium]